MNQNELADVVYSNVSESLDYYGPLSLTYTSSTYTSPAGVTGVYDFRIDSGPPFSRLTVFVNGQNYNALTTPAGQPVGDPLITDRMGQCSGKIVIIHSATLAPAGSYSIVFYDPETNGAVAKFTVQGISSAPPGTGSTRDAVVVGDDKIEDASAIPTFTSLLTPLTQTFFVDASTYPKGLFVASIDLWFAEKDSLSPISLQLRKVTGGIPSSTEIIPGSVCVIPANNVVIPANATSPLTTGLIPATRTSFPIFSKLLPGEYGICVVGDSANYSLYTAEFGKISPKTNAIVTKEPYVGKLFKSQNTNTWIEEQNKSICFSVNKAVFEKGTAFFELQTEAIPETLYDAVLLDAMTTGEEEISGISYSINQVNRFSAPGNFDGAVSLTPNVSRSMDRRKKAVAKGDIKIGVTFTNDSADVSPVLDKSKLSIFTFANQIDPFDLDTQNSELGATGWAAQSRYVSKVITLATGFDSSGLEVRLAVNRKYGTDIDVFCRVKSALDLNTENTIENLPWRRMPLYNEKATITAPDSLESKKTFAAYTNDFYSEVYKLLETDSVATTGFANLEYETLVGETLTTFKTFNQFQIKVVFYSNDTTIVPKIRNLIATAVI